MSWKTLGCEIVDYSNVVVCLAIYLADLRVVDWGLQLCGKGRQHGSNPSLPPSFHPVSATRKLVNNIMVDPLGCLFRRSSVLIYASTNVPAVESS